jgi:hypothetical protein
MHSPGRKVLKLAVKVLGWFAWLPIEKIIGGPIKRFDELDGYDVMERVFSRVERVDRVEKDGRCLAAKNAKVAKNIEWLTLYMGNDSAKTKLTVKVKCFNAYPPTEGCPQRGCPSRGEAQRRRERRDCLIIKLGRTEAAADAIRNEVKVLTKLADTPLKVQVPSVVGDVESDGIWTWSMQSVVPKGKSPVWIQREHREFLEELNKAGLSHVDFAPWNCSIVGGKLYVWDWEDAGEWIEGKDESWFKGQVRKLLGIES